MLLPRQRTLPAQVESLWAETLAKELPVASAVAARKEQRLEPTRLLAEEEEDEAD